MNHLLPFRFANHIAHGAFVVIDEGIGALLDPRAYPAPVRALVGEAVAAMPLIATHALFEGRINLQFQSEGAIKLLVAQLVQRRGDPFVVRGMAKPARSFDATTDGASYRSLLAGGVLALMLEPADDAQPSRQALVPITGESLSESLESYFAQSEQLPTLIRLAASADGSRLAGFLLQRLPLEHTRATEDDWNHLAILAGTLGADELLATPPETLMRRLFANEDWAFAEAEPVDVRCRCSREGISLLLRSLGREEVESIIAEQGRVEVTCEFCGRPYVYSHADTATLFVELPPTEAGVRH